MGVPHMPQTISNSVSCIGVSRLADFPLVLKRGKRDIGMLAWVETGEVSTNHLGRIPDQNRNLYLRLSGEDVDYAWSSSVTGEDSHGCTRTWPLPRLFRLSIYGTNKISSFNCSQILHSLQELASPAYIKDRSSSICSLDIRRHIIVTPFDQSNCKGGPRKIQRENYDQDNPVDD